MSRGPRRSPPEVVQTSAMDCGPAALCSVLRGFGLQVSLGRLREACHTDVDGTSIDDLEDVALALGLDAVQTLVPADDLLRPEAAMLPAIVVVEQPDESTHFLVVWRVRGDRVQVMDPGAGRRWMRCADLRAQLYRHTATLPTEAVEGWLAAPETSAVLRRRLRAIGAGPMERWCGGVDARWLTQARLHAAARLVERLVHVGAVRPGAEAQRLLAERLGRLATHPTHAMTTVPEELWTAWPQGEQAQLRGAVVLRFGRGQGGARSDLHARPELHAAATRPEPSPLAMAAAQLRDLRFTLVPLLLAGLVVGAGLVLVEALLLRGLLTLGSDLVGLGTRAAAAAIVLLVLLLGTVVEAGNAAGILTLGRRLELRLRLALLHKLPRLHDRYLHSRPLSDMAQRAHGLHEVRALPQQLGHGVQAVTRLLAVAAGLCWLSPAVTPLVLALLLASVAVPLAFRGRLRELDLRVRTHGGALAQHYLDALRGLTAVRAHRAESAVQAAHEGLLVQWMRAGREQVRRGAVLSAIQLAVGFGGAASIIAAHAIGGGAPTSLLLLAYWSLAIPAVGGELVRVVLMMPRQTNTLGRIVEPLFAPDAEEAEARSQAAARDDAVGAALSFEGVTVVAGGHALVREVDLRIPPGAQVALVGASGAGKSTLAALLLGFHRPAAGQVRVDGVPLGPDTVVELRRGTAWIDPAVHLWNRSVLDNLRYGSLDQPAADLHEVLRISDLEQLVAHLPEGLQAQLGEGGRALSGGQGQRVRMGRALARTRPRLVILDEAFRGLDRATRRRLLRRAREHWRGSTLLCISHDVTDTVDFDRVVVMHQGRVREDGEPRRLAALPGSAYRTLLEGERRLQQTLADPRHWRRLVMDGGRVQPRTREATREETSCAS